MKLFKTVPALVMAAGVLASMNAVADDTVFTVMDDPASAKKNHLKVMLTVAISVSQATQRVPL